MIQVSPKTFTFDDQSCQLEVEFVDGSIRRYFGISDPLNQLRGADFLTFINSQRHVPRCPGTNDGCECLCPIFFEVENGKLIIFNWELVKDSTGNRK